MKDRDAEREKQKLQINREELIERMLRLVPEDGSKEILPGFFLARASKTMESAHSIYQPAFCFVVQGGKREIGRAHV